MRSDREIVAQWMIDNSFATGHGDTLADLLMELQWQITELRDKNRGLEELLQKNEAI